MRKSAIVGVCTLLAACASGGASQSTCGARDGGANHVDAARQSPADAGRRDAYVARDAYVPIDDAGWDVELDAALDDASSPADADVADAGVADAAIAPDAATCDEFTADNASHVATGRAYFCGAAHACALGSGTDLGAWSTTVTTTLRRVAPFRYELGPCP